MATTPNEPFPPILGFRRRCAWCGVQLRGWQMNVCKRCGSAIVGHASAPCPPGSRWDEAPDGLERLTNPTGSVGS